MSDNLNGPTSAIKESKSTIPHSYYRPHLQLPTELLIDIIAALDSPHLEKNSLVYDPLPTLRL